MKVNKIIVHHSATADNLTVSWGAIRKYHIEKLGFQDIGYHAGVELVESGGRRYYESFLGRSWFVPGAHCRGQNHDSLGICLVGNFDLEIPDYGLLEAGAKVVALWMALFAVPHYMIFPHNAFNPQKSCPGELFKMEKFIEMAVQEFDKWKNWK